MMMNCIHHWMIAPAEMGRPSLGVCQKCNESREFMNYVEVGVTEGDTSAMRIAKNRAQRKLHMERKQAGASQGRVKTVDDYSW